MDIIKGKQQKAQKTVIYGPEGVGKSTFASQFPDPLFIDTEDSTAHMDVARFKKPTSWTMLMDQVAYVKANPGICKTLIIDTADWAEMLCIEHITSKAGMKGIEDFGYGKGYVYLEEEYGRFLNALQDVIERGIHVTVTAHAEIKKIEQPEEIGGYDHWQMKLEKKTMPLLKEWADMLIFANYQVQVINVDNQGATKGKNKAQGGKRIMYTTHSPWWDAKNRHGLADELPLEFKSIAHAFTVDPPMVQDKAQQPKQEPVKDQLPETVPEPDFTPMSETENFDDITLGIDDNVPKNLADLMREKQVSVFEIQMVVGQKGYYPVDTQIANYDPGFIQGVLVAAWPQVFALIEENRKNDLKIQF